MKYVLVPIFALALAACGGSDAAGIGDGGDSGWGDTGDTGEPGGPACGGSCTPGFHCEFDTCVPDAPPPQVPGDLRSPLTSGRYVFTLETASRRLIRIDSLSLQVAAYPAGLAPMDLAVVGSRELSVLLDAYDLVEVLDHRSDPPVAAGWTTARSLSHAVLSPTGAHAILYFDWDDSRAQLRQPEPGNINQVSVLYLGDESTPFNDDDLRITNVAVGFLPRDIRFSSDGLRAIVISRDQITPIDLGTTLGGELALPNQQITFDETATEILINSEGTHAVLRYADDLNVDVIGLDDDSHGCFEALGPVTDIAFTTGGELLILAGDGLGTDGASLSVTTLGQATEPCLPLATDLALTNATRVALNAAGDTAVAYQPSLAVESLWRITLATFAAETVRLEKAVSGIAFAGDGRYALASHLKAEGVPAWDPLVEDPSVSVDKSYGVTWLDLEADLHRLEVSDTPFGNFTFVPALDGQPGATFQAIADPSEPQILRVTHGPGFNDHRIDLAAIPLDLGFLPETERGYVTQDHPWGRVTFLDPAGDDLRHVTGFALEVQ